MKIIREMRKRHGWSLTGLAAHLGIPHQRLSEYERGRALPTPESAQALAEVLGLDLPSAQDEFSPQQIGFRWTPRGFGLEHHSRRHWEKALEEIEPPNFQSWVVNFIRCDSSLEACAWLQWLEDGARAGLMSPLKLDFRAHHLLDEAGHPLGQRPLPCLHHPRLQMLLWPQVSLKTSNYQFRCDALYFDGNWAILEIDGPGHRSGGDDFRKRQLCLSEWRFSESEIRSYGLPYLLKERQTKRRTGGP